MWAIALVHGCAFSILTLYRFDRLPTSPVSHASPVFFLHLFIFLCTIPLPVSYRAIFSRELLLVVLYPFVAHISLAVTGIGCVFSLLALYRSCRLLASPVPHASPVFFFFTLAYLPCARFHCQFAALHSFHVNCSWLFCTCLLPFLRILALIAFSVFLRCTGLAGCLPHRFRTLPHFFVYFFLHSLIFFVLWFPWFYRSSRTFGPKTGERMSGR